jgi:predicted GNAT superfamily acetyltransferase
MAEDMELALDWRLKTRELFRAYFERGYVVKGFHRSELGVFYRLEREDAPAD